MSAVFEENDEQVTREAIKRVYNNRRDLINSQKGDYNDSLRKAKKRRSRKQRIFNRRSHHVTKKEKGHWKQLSIHYVTEESDAEDDEGELIVTHKLPWRLDALNKYMGWLDARKRRKEESLSSSVPPSGASIWAIKNTLLQQQKEPGVLSGSPGNESINDIDVASTHSANFSNVSPEQSSDAEKHNYNATEEYEDF